VWPWALAQSTKRSTTLNSGETREQCVLATARCPLEQHHWPDSVVVRQFGSSSGPVQSKYDKMS
jgi:hypothetical protein